MIVSLQKAFSDEGERGGREEADPSESISIISIIYHNHQRIQTNQDNHFPQGLGHERRQLAIKPSRLSSGLDRIDTKDVVDSSRMDCSHCR